MNQRSPRRLGAAAAMGAIALIALLGAQPLEGARADDEAGTGNVSVTIVDPTTPSPTATPSPSPSSTAAPSGTTGVGSSTGGGGSGSGASTGSGSTTTPDGASPGGDQPADELSLGGVLYIGGLGAEYTPSTDPLAGSVDLVFTVRNASETTFDAEVVAWTETPLGTRIDTASAEIAGLAGDEVRTIRLRTSGVGQWPIVNAFVTVTPPNQVEGTTLTPVTREASVFTFPWAFGLLALVVAATIAITRFVRARRAAVPIREPQGVTA
ncbi:hypothetical protein [Agromyces seonyuensis]|uniref:DUF916 domain-containing protein n=1 Tax=Agromyces seonyuensis TaxID=2662446 RepID=A0A6I4NUW3_9MICO|nr:hypothetical protein [Agromyces seonyuensis]MWB97881.1 hypothetical protein [Agromyces seonyuensis]